MADMFDRYKVIDVDTHVTEPRDVWTSRVSSKWGDQVPHVIRMGKVDMWMIGDKPVMPPGITATAGFDGFIPDFPRTYEDAITAAYDAKARLAHMDAEGIHAQVLYPNLGGFGSARFLELKEPELMLECVRAYNDWLVEWCSADPNRLLPIMATPFWDLDASIAGISTPRSLRSNAAQKWGTRAFSSEVSSRALVSRRWSIPIGIHFGQPPRMSICPSASTSALGTTPTCSRTRTE